MSESDPILKHGWPEDQWSDLNDQKIPLSTRIISEEWAKVTNNRVPELTLAHYLAAHFIVFSRFIPPRIKDSVVSDKPDWIRKSLNSWNREIGHLAFQRLSNERANDGYCRICYKRLSDS